MRNIIWYVVIGLLLILNVAIFINGINLSCDKCIVSFKNTQISGADLAEPFIVADIAAQQLYNDYNQGYCTITWDKTMGFQK